MSETQPCSERGQSLTVKIRKAHSRRKKKISWEREVNTKYCMSSKVGELRPEQIQKVFWEKVTSDMGLKGKVGIEVSLLLLFP